MMRIYPGWIAMAVMFGVNSMHSRIAVAQTPEQEQLWAAQKAQLQAEDKVKADRLAQQRDARKADPMAWVRTLNPMSAGGWQFRAVAADGSWASFSTDHQLKRSGHLVTVWLRQEYPEPQRGNAGDLYLSYAEKIQYDCGNERARALSITYYSDNNISGSERSESSDPKQIIWDPIIPGTQSEYIYAWACAAGTGKPHS